MKKKYFSVLIIVAFLVSIIYTGSFPVPATSAQEEGNGKVSGLLRLQVEVKLSAQEVGQLDEGQAFILQPMREEDAVMPDLATQRIFIHFEEKPDEMQIAELETMGLTVYSDSWIPPVGIHTTGFIIADMPVDKLDALADKNYVSWLDTAEQQLEPHNDNATQAMNVDDVWTTYNGSGVTICVIDSGLDVTHADIPTPVASKDYYNYPNSLDDTITNYYGGTGHGTHVTGSALGRAANTVNSTYNGSAPGADLVFLKIGGDTTTTANTSAMVGAIQAATDNYSADIITMSYGGWDTYHDGSSQTAQAVDYAVSQGAVVFISAGNDADDDQHYYGTVGGETWSDWIEVTVSQTAYLYFNMVWYDGTARNDLDLLAYNSQSLSDPLTPYTSLGQYEGEDRGTESEYSYYGEGGSLSPISAGTYYLRVYNWETSAQDFHIYGLTSYVTFASPNAAYTIGSPADADSAIAVGSYTTRKVWYDYANNGWQYTYETVGQISTFSSQGPRVDDGATGKVNIVTPGCAIISCRDNIAYPWADKNPYYVDDEGPNTANATKNNGAGPATYYVMQGTSMACPHAAGVGALILEAHPTWTPAQVRHALESTGTDNGTAGFDNIWGWGTVDALAAVNSSLPTANSYSDSSHSTSCDTFDDYGTEHTVYMNITDLHPSHTYRVLYYDGSDNLTCTDDNIVSGASGNVSSLHTFDPEVDQPGTWHVVVCEPEFTTSSYNSTWPYTITSVSFEVTEDAIPEFPTVITAIAVCGICAGIYFWLRRKSVPVPA